MTGIIFYFGQPLLVILVVIFLGFIIKVLFDYKNGLVDMKKIYHKIDIKYASIETIYNQLDSASNFHRIKLLTKDMLIYMNEYSINLVMIKDYTGNIFVEKEKWTLKGAPHDRKINNPYEEFKNTEKYLEDILNNFEVRRYLILSSLCIMNENDLSIKLIRIKNAFYEINKKEIKKLYTKDEINNFFEKLVWSEKNEINN